MTKPQLETIVRAILTREIDEGYASDTQVEALVLLHDPIIKAREVLTLALAKTIDCEFAARLAEELRMLDTEGQE